MVHDLYDYLKRNLEKMDDKQLRKMERELQGIVFLIKQQRAS
ncbi:hypothetical protein P4V41_07620 [Fictibacillus nanhaiensis]|nr:hypothetical protein [Fictibacillus nanhaiensis]